MAKKLQTNNLATKTDIKILDKNIKKLRLELKTTKKSLWNEILRVGEKVENIEESQDRVETKLDKIADTLDGFVGKVDNLTKDNTVGTEHTRELRVQVNDHELRISNLESTTS